MKKSFNIENQSFYIQVRNRWFGYDRMVPVSRNNDGEFTDWWDGKKTIGILGVRVGYQIPINLPLELVYSYEADATYKVSTLGVSWKF